MSKSDRKLRSGTRKDYEKLADGVDGDISSSEERETGLSDENNIAVGEKQKQQAAIIDGQILDSELARDSDDNNTNDGASSDELSEPDDDIARAQEKLLSIKKEKKKLAKKAKLERIARETEEAQKSLEKLKKQKTKTKTGKKKNVTVESLREM